MVPHYNTINARLSDIRLIVQYTEQLQSNPTLSQYWPGVYHKLGEVLKKLEEVTDIIRGV